MREENDSTKASQLVEAIATRLPVVSESASMTRTGRELPDDLRHVRAAPDWDSDDLGAFRLISRDSAAALLICMAVLAVIFAPYF